MVFKNHDLPDALPFAYEDSNHVGSKVDALSVRKVDGRGEADEDVDNSEKKSSEDNEEKNSKLSDANLETGIIPEK